MLKQFNLKKEYGLIVATLLILVVSYQLAFKKTIGAWQLNKELKSQLIQSTDLSYQPGYLERKNVNLDKILSLYKSDTTSFRNNIISSISSIAEKENVKLAGVPFQDPSYHTNQFIIQKLNFEGDYFSLLKTNSLLQQLHDGGMIRSLTIRSIGIHSNNDEKRKLVLEVYLEIANN